MDAPFFSIVIPTKDRPHILKENLDSCLAQTFGDFEAIVVDNSTDASATFEAVAAYKDPRIKYVRTGGLSMPDNWDAALRQGSGKFVYIIGDRLILHPITLENVAQGIERTGLDVLGFRDVAFSKLKSLKRLNWNIVETAPLIEKLSSGKLPQSHVGLRGYALILSRKYLRELLAKYDKIAIPTSPDYSMAYFSILNCKQFAYCDERFFKTNAQSTSNGTSAYYGGRLAAQFLKELGKSEEELMMHVPLKVMTINNLLLNDLIAVCKICGVEHRMEEPELIKYWNEIYSELCISAGQYHIDRTEDFRKCFNFAEEKFIIRNKELIGHISNNSFVKRSALPSLIAKEALQKRFARKLRDWLRSLRRKISGKAS